MPRFSPIRTIGLFGLALFMAGPASGETCSECQQKVQTSLAACMKQVPRKIKLADPKKPTDAEKKAETERLDKSRACSFQARDGFASCRRTASCR